MSIFSGWEKGDLATLRDALTGSPEGLAMLFAFVLILILILFLMVRIVSHQISNFALRVTEEDALEDEEEQPLPDSPADSTVKDSSPHAEPLPEPAEADSDSFPENSSEGGLLS